MKMKVDIKNKIETALQSLQDSLQNHQPSLQDRYSWSFFENQYENAVSMVEFITEHSLQDDEITKEDLIGYLQQLAKINNDFIRKLYEQDS